MIYVHLRHKILFIVTYFEVCMKRGGAVTKNMLFMHDPYYIICIN